MAATGYKGQIIGDLAYSTPTIPKTMAPPPTGSSR